MFKKFFSFLKEVKVELKDKTTWPSKDDVLNSTIVTVVSILVVSLALYLVDIVSNQSIQFIVVDNINYFKTFVNEFSYLVFVVLFTLIVIFYYRVRARFFR